MERQAREGGGGRVGEGEQGRDRQEKWGVRVGEGETGKAGRGGGNGGGDERDSKGEKF